MRQLTAIDNQFLDMEDARNVGHVGFLAFLDPSTAPGGTLDSGDLCRVVGERLDLLPPFRWKLAPVPFNVDRPYWIEDPDFDLDFHIREIGLPAGGGERALAEQVSRISSRALDRARPLWELYVIQNLPDGQIGLLTKMHHAAVDGVSGVEVLSVLFDDAPEGRELPPPASRRPDPAPSDIELFWRGVLKRPLQPLRAWQAASRLMPRVGMTPPAPPVLPQPDVLQRPMTPTPSTRFNDRISGHRRYSFGQLSLDEVKAVKNAFGVTVNDVVVALCAGALREWLTERDELPKEPLVAMVPVSVREPEQMGTYGNRVSALFVPIPTDEPDAVARLRRTHETLKGAKEFHRAVPAQALQEFAEFIPPAVSANAARMALQLVDRRRPAINCVISNVPGPQTPLYCAGARLNATYPVSVISDGMGLNITVMSYCGHLDFGIVVDRDHVDDAWPLMDGLRDALEIYKDAKP